MSETVGLQSEIEVPEIQEVDVPVVDGTVQEISYEYQPIDDNGKPYGRPQVIKGANWEEIAKKVAHNHMEATKELRKQVRRNRLGEYEQDVIPADAPRITHNVITPRELTAEEKLEIAKDFLDPAKVDSAFDRLTEAKFGAKPDVITQKINKAAEDEEALRAKAEAELFVRTTPEYYVCDDNFYTMANWLIKNSLAPVCGNWKLAFNTLNAAGLLVSAPTMREETTPVVETVPATVQTTNEPEIPANPQSEVATTSRITSEEPSQPRRAVGVASGLNKSTMTFKPSTSVQTQSNTLTVEVIEKMSADEYKKRMKTERGFANRVDELYAERDRQRQLRSQQ